MGHSNYLFWIAHCCGCLHDKPVTVERLIAAVLEVGRYETVCHTGTSSDRQKAYRHFSWRKGHTGMVNKHTGILFCGNSDIPANPHSTSMPVMLLMQLASNMWSQQRSPINRSVLWTPNDITHTACFSLTIYHLSKLVVVKNGIKMRLTAAVHI